MHYTIEEIREIPIFFIVGKGRSGTTLLSTILDSHPEVASATESRFLFVLWERYKNLKTWKPEMAEEFYNNVLLDLHIKKLWTFQDNFIEELRGLPKETTVQDLIKMVYLYRSSNFPKEKIKIIVDKNPMFAIFTEKIKSIFSNAKFYRLIRDPRDNITSHIRKSNQHCGVLASKWLDFNLKIDQLAKDYPNDVLTQRFEDLITNKEDFFTVFEKYTGISSLAEIEEVRLKYKNEFEAKFDKKLKEQHQASVKPLDKSKIGHFQKALNSTQIEVIEAITFPYAENYSYIKTSSNINISNFKKKTWSLKYKLIVFPSKVLFNLPFSAMKLASKYFEKKSAKL